MILEGVRCGGQAYEGLETAHNLREEYLFLPDKVKDVYVLHVLAGLADRGVRSAIVFVSRRRTAQLLSLLLDEMDVAVATLHSGLPQGTRLAALDRCACVLYLILFSFLPKLVFFT